ncbi:MAG: cation:proton antiporter [Deltaproteobacteria bacterium]|nr:cation:proton antiporter [Deltaproteobacteria bacterium]
MTFPSESDFALFLFQLFILLSAAFLLGGLFRRLGQAPVIGEILAGVLLGPSILGNLFPEFSSALFPPSQTHMLGTLAWLGSLFLLLVTGMEIDLPMLRKESRVIFSTSLMGIVIPSAIGFFFAFYLPDKYLADSSQRWLFAVFMATAMSISAIPMVAKILMDLNLLKTPVGHVIIGSAVINDLIGWTFFTVILSGMSGGVVGGGSLAGVLFMVLGFTLFCLTVGRSLMVRVFSFFHMLHLPPEGVLGLSVLIAFLCAALTQWVGIHAVFGAYIAGVMIGETGEITDRTRDTLVSFVLYLFAPIFFATMGQRADFIANFDLFLVLGVVLIACVGKIVGGTLGALIGGMERSDALAVGFGLNARGAMEIILAFLALEYSLINEKVFVALVITAIATSVMGGPLIQWAMRGSVSIWGKSNSVGQRIRSTLERS